MDTLFAAAQNSQETDPIKIAVVPFAASVNVGSSHAGDSWMDTTGIGKYHAYEQKCYANGGTLNSSGACSVSVGTAINNFTLFNSLKDSSGNAITWGGCVEARPEPYDVQDDAPSTGNPSTMFVPMFAPDESDNWTATTSNCTVAKVAHSPAPMAARAAALQARRWSLTAPLPVRTTTTTTYPMPAQMPAPIPAAIASP